MFGCRLYSVEILSSGLCFSSEPEFRHRFNCCSPAHRYYSSLLVVLLFNFLRHTIVLRHMEDVSAHDYKLDFMGDLRIFNYVRRTKSSPFICSACVPKQGVEDD